MANHSVLYNIFADLLTAVSSVIDKKYVFLQDRPKTNETDSPMQKFAVISLPGNISDTVIGNRKTLLETYGIIYLFTRSRKNGTLNIEATGDIVDNITDKFPISGKYCVAKKPIVRMTGDDGYGFQVTTISFDLYCRWGVFENNKQLTQ